MIQKSKKCIVTKVAAMILVAVMAVGVVPQTASVVSAASVSASKAEKIALKNARCSSSNAYALDSDDTVKSGKDAWKVSFYKKLGDRKYTHYVYYINSKTGKIIKKAGKTYTIIRARKAKNIALDDEGYDRDDVNDLDCELDEDDDRLVYTVSFSVKKSSSSTEYSDYEYTINAVNGNIIDSDEDDDD